MKKRALIVGTMHPKGLMRAQVRLLPDWQGVDDKDLPWAEYLMPIGNGFVPTIKGDLVWVEFPYMDHSGKPDTRRPLIVGAAEQAPGGVPNVAPEASGQGSPYDPGKVDGAPARPATSKTKDAVLHRNNLLEIRTAGGGYEIANTAAGSRVGMNEAGQIYIISPGNTVLNVGAALTIKAGGGVSITAGGAFSVKAASVAFEKG
ncbi:phage baseplate assembly protein V [Rosenbergiella collisarenosi]|uniref:phage baseplate assembly protein V n=1 Tax=Rosenbergiella collisarenosi TaxID=1544695 RepID=UPI001F4E52C5|nr:phage baseplate assembly protein V [Rosenbergiella collisarenosi]